MNSTKSVKPSVERVAEELESVFSTNRMVIFLCGPSLEIHTPGSKLRQRLKDELEKDGFEVVLGEDDGLEALRQQFKGMYAHENELAFIKKEAGAIVLIADSVGSYCELGLFAYVQSHEDTNRRDFILIIDKKFESKVSFLNEGPAKAIKHFGAVLYADLELFDTKEILERLQGRRVIYFLDGRGRPAKGSNR